MASTLARGIVWSVLLREMEQDWAAGRERAEAAPTVTELCRSEDETAADHRPRKAA